MVEGAQVVGLDACAATQVDDERVAATRPLVVSAGEESGITGGIRVRRGSRLIGW